MLRVRSRIGAVLAISLAVVAAAPAALPTSSAPTAGSGR